MHSQSNGAGHAGPQDRHGPTSLDHNWIRTWTNADWSVWMAECRERRKAASGHLKKATRRQKAFLKHRRLDARVLEFVTAYEAHYLIDRLNREEIAFETWRAKKRAAGEWGMR